MRGKNSAPSAPSLHRSFFALKPEEEKGLAQGPTGSWGLSGAGRQLGDPEICNFSRFLCLPPSLASEAGLEEQGLFSETQPSLSTPLPSPSPPRLFCSWHSWASLLDGGIRDAATLSVLSEVELRQQSLSQTQSSWTPRCADPSNDPESDFCQSLLWLRKQPVSITDAISLLRAV